MRRAFLIFATLFLLIGCGNYQPVNGVAKSIFDNPVLVNVQLDPEDPDSGRVLQKELKKMVINRLNLTLTENIDSASSYLLVNNYTVNTVPVTKDKDGNVIRYSIYIAMQVAMKDRAGFWSQNVTTGTYVVVKAQSQLSKQDKDKATKVAIKKAVDDLVVEITKRAKEKGDSVALKDSDANSNSNNSDNTNTTQDTPTANLLPENYPNDPQAEDLAKDLNNLKQQIDEYNKENGLNSW